MKKSKATRNGIFCSTIFLGCCLSSGPVIAQYALEEIIVTAQKREENLQDVGVTVNAYNADSIRALGISNTADVGRYTPNVSVRNTYGDMLPIITIRGVGASTNDIVFVTSQPSAAIHVDQVFLGTPSLLNFSNFDLERVEVLKGPQGTLYGRNTTAGTINYISRKPQDEFGAGLDLDYLNYETGGAVFGASGFVTGPLGGNFSGRLAFNLKQGDHFVTDLGGDPYRGPDDLAVRGLLAWEGENADVLVNVHAGKNDSGSYPAHIIAILGNNGNTCSYPFTGQIDPITCAGGGLPTNIILDDLTTIVPFNEPTNPFNDDVFRNGSSYGDDETQSLENTGASVTINLGLGEATLTSITAFESSDIQRLEDFSGRDVPLYLDIRHRDEVDQFSQELRLAGGNDRLNWLVGGFFYTEDIDYELRSHFQSNAIGQNAAGDRPHALPTQFRTHNIAVHETDAFAFFGQLEYQFSDDWKVTLGARYNDEDKSYLRRISYNLQRVAGIDFLIPDPNPVINPTNGLPVQEFLRADSLTPYEASWDNVSYKVGLDYQLSDDTLLYGSVSTGFKAGAFSGSSLILPAALADAADPEELTSYEVGVKTTFADGRARINASAFYYDYQDLQIISTVRLASGDNSSILDNISEAEVTGLDVDFTWAPTDSFLLNASLGLLDGEYKNFISGDGTDFSGTPLVNAPDLTATVRGVYEWQTSAGNTVALGVDVLHSDEIDLDFRGTLESGSSFNRARVQFVTPSHQIVNARLSWRTADEKTELALWVRNLTDEEVLIHSTFGTAEVVEFYDKPRSVGATLSFKF